MRLRRRASGPVAAILACLLLLIPAGCSDAPGGDAAETAPASPLLYEIASADGAVEGWMLGTIHALPSGTRWRTAAIDRVIDEADLLVVEIAGLRDRSNLASTFAELAASPGLPPLSERLPAELRPQLASLMERGGLSPEAFANRETWAAAITLAQIDATGDPASGADRAVIEEFAGRPIVEFEGAYTQLSIFDRLPEGQQRGMLAAIVRESEKTGRDPARLRGAWLAGDAATIEQSTREGFLADPALREALLTGRNRNWIAALVPMLAKPARPLVAVGTAHLVGPEGIAALLEANGYRIRRLS
ncbi:MAG: TraB/GumN family protein [Sphingomonadales bacterium]|nr:MAG: TraB/GumN family protein [Sphingomonadales bacterium]